MHEMKAVESELDNKYEIVRIIASGGMGCIYLGLHRALQKKVAIKVIHKQYISNQEYKKRFIREAKLIARLEHPNIIDIYDFGSTENFDYFIMPYIEGETLKDILIQSETPDIEKNISIIISIAEALNYAHGNDVVHRDIKPANIMITHDNRALLTDFGISKDLIDQELTLPDTVMGSPKYMSPEQIKGLKADARSDLYSLGIILYEAVTGQYPFKGKNIQALYYSHIHETPPPPSSNNPDVPAALDRLILSLISKEVEKRVNTAGEVSNTLKTILTDLKNCRVQPTPQGTGNPRPFPLKWKVFAGTALVLVIITGGLFTLRSGKHVPIDSPPTGDSETPVFEVTSVNDSTITPPARVTAKAIKDQPADEKDKSTTIEEQPEGIKDQPEGINEQIEEIEVSHVPGLEILASPLLEIKASKKTYDIGEKLLMTLKTLHPCHLHLIYRDVAGDMTLIFPNGYEPDQALPNTQELMIPRQSWGIDLELTGPGGEEVIYALASSEEIKLLEPDYSAAPFYSLAGHEKKIISQIVQDVKEKRMGPIQVHEARFTIH